MFAVSPEAIMSLRIERGHVQRLELDESVINQTMRMDQQKYDERISELWKKLTIAYQEAASKATQIHSLVDEKAYLSKRVQALEEEVRQLRDKLDKRGRKRWRIVRSSENE